MRITILLILFSLSVRAGAHVPADGDIRATVGAMAYRTDTPLAAAFHLDPGLLVEADLHKHGGAELSMFYLRNAFTVRSDGYELTEQVKRIYISMGYRYWFNEKISAALAFSSSYTIGDHKVLRNTFGTNPTPNTSATDITEYGLDGSVQYEFWTHRRFAAVADARYGYSLTPKRNELSNHIGVYVGLKWFVQSRQASVYED